MNVDSSILHMKSMAGTDLTLFTLITLCVAASRSGMGHSAHSTGQVTTPGGGFRSGSGAPSTAGRRGLSSAAHTPGVLQTAVIVGEEGKGGGGWARVGGSIG